MFQSLFNSYNDFHVDKITKNRFQPEEFHQLINSYRNIKLTQEANSVEGRPIYSIKMGTGPVKVMMWSQMHGNESTATRALLDLLNFNESPNRFGEQWRQILEKLTVIIVPIINPDGTARFIRRNALDIDLNRDAREFVSPEAQLLKRLFQEIKPDFGFNLHDQKRHYNIMDTPRPSSISFLAPAFNAAEEINNTRGRAMQLIACLSQELQKVIPGRVGIYNDSFAPRAFGDYAQSLGISTVLVESGWQAYDMEKEGIRKLNFCMLISGLQTIASKGYEDKTVEDYEGIPLNDDKMLDVLIRGASLSRGKEQYIVDIGIERTEIPLPPTGDYYSRGEIKDLGDLKEWYGFEEVDATGLMAIPGRVLEKSFEEWEGLTETEQSEYLKEGYLYLVGNEKDKHAHIPGPINSVLDLTSFATNLRTEDLANFILINKAGEIQYVVINGFLCPAFEALPEELNGLIIK